MSLKSPVFGRVDAVLFDFDGTLVDTEAVGPKVFAEVLGDCGIDAQTWADQFGPVWRRIDQSRTVDGLFVSALGLRAGAEAMREFEKRFNVEALDAPESPGATELLRSLHSRSIPTAVVSHAPERHLIPQLERRHWDNLFTLVYPYELFKAPKPDPSCYQDAISQLGSAPERSVVLEDSDMGLEAARLAGAQAVKLCAEAAGCVLIAKPDHVHSVGELGQRLGPAPLLAATRSALS